MTHLDRQRAARLMAAAEIDALLLFAPESFTYATGAPPGVGTMWRRAGAAAALVPADPALPLGAVVSDLFAAAFGAASPIGDVRIVPLWVETADLRVGGDHDGRMADMFADAWRREGRGQGFARPETFDVRLGMRQAADLIAARRLDTGRIGLELDSLSVADFAQVQAALPNATLVDGSDVLRRLKMVKSPAEIDFLRTAVGLAEAGIAALRPAIRQGVAREALSQAWRTGVEMAARAADERRLTGLWDYISVGENPWAPGGVVRVGDLIKVDVGCLVSGYTSDTGRTFVCGTASPLQTEVFAALEAAFAAGLALIRPGTEMRAVHHAAGAALAEVGLPGFTRGHFGHGLGHSLGSEEWPFFSASSDVLLEPGMVVAFETPFYVDGLGGLIIEDQLLVTETGHETMNRLPRGLVEL